MEKKRNPNSHCRESFWSELPVELLNLVFERLSFPDFQRAKSVCSSWYASSTQSKPKNQIIPWLILFPENKSNYCMLFNPEEKHKLYQTKDLGLEFAKSVCIATYGSWLLMQDPRYNLYIVNLFTHERIINLPPVDSQLGMIKVKRTIYGQFLVSDDHTKSAWGSKGITIQSPVFWINEETEDYVVIWGLRRCGVVYSKKGDNFWKQIPDSSNCHDLAYMDHKLYFYTDKHLFKIFNFAGEIPQQTFQHRFDTTTINNLYRVVEAKLVVTVRGDVFRVVCLIPDETIVRSFHVYKVYSPESGSKDYEYVDSWDDEAMLLESDILVLATDIEGFNRNSIYLSGVSHKIRNITELFLFNLGKLEVEQFYRFDSSSIQFSGTRWFLPSFKHK